MVKEIAVQKYDVLKDTWIYQEIRQQVAAEQRQHYIADQQQLVLEIVQLRFPQMETLARETLQTITEVSKLRALLLKMGTVDSEQEARQYLAGINRTTEPA